MWDRIVKAISIYCQALLCGMMYVLFYILPLDISSNFGGYIAEKIGPYFKASKVARLNLSKIMPQLSSLEIESIIAKMWNNLGRILAEIPHFASMNSEEFCKRIVVVLEKDINPAKIRSSFIVSAHYGNWEIYNRLNKEYKSNMHMVQRPLNNALCNNLLEKLRMKAGAKSLINKSVEGVRSMMAFLARGDNIGVLVDQKANDGIDVPFMGYNAKCTNLVEKLSLKGNHDIYCTRVIRKDGAYFKIEFYKFKSQGLTQENAITTALNAEMEKWIRERPELWMWVHDRWGFAKHESSLREQ